jgi:hypothetical protein
MMTHNHHFARAGKFENSFTRAATLSAFTHYDPIAVTLGFTNLSGFGTQWFVFATCL